MVNELVEKKAAELLKKCNINSAPVKLNKVVGCEKLKLKSLDLGDDEISGLFFRELSTIAVNSKHSNTRKRFTAAHELGHYYLHRKYDKFVDEVFLRSSYVSEQKKNIEREANQFAAALLMPIFMIEKEIINKKIDRDFLAKLADTFEVSMQAMSFRLLNLGLITEDYSQQG